MNLNQCPCGSKHLFSECCGPIIKGQLNALTAEALMRSRYSAFVLKDSEYLSLSWHPSTRPLEIDLVSDPLEWLGLNVIEVMDGGQDDLEGAVKFKARFKAHGQPGELVEKSRFIREGDRWLYLDGEQPADGPHTKVGRNESCPCGSGKKYKRCCGG